jgi:hypothetical protein
MRHFIVVLSTALPLVLVTAVLDAQTSVTGLVRDSAGIPIGGAEVAVETLNRLTHTDEAGRYRLLDLTPGMRLLRVRRVGFSPFSRMVQMAEGENKQNDIVLGHLITKLDTVITRNQMLYHEDPLLRDFDENRKLGLGHFVTRADLEKMRGHQLDELVSQFPGTRVVHGGSRAAYIASTRRSSINQECAQFEDQRPTWPERFCICFPPVYLDNQLLSQTEVPNINRFSPDQVEAIEIYAGPAQTPPKYAGLGSQCGIVIIHSRRPP